MKAPRAKLTVPHTPLCRAVAACTRGTSERRWRTPWYLPATVTTHYRDTMFRKNGTGRRWIELNCNATNCGARCVVRADDIEELGPRP